MDKVIVQSKNLIRCPKCEKLVATFSLEVSKVKDLNLASSEARCIICDYPIGRIEIKPHGD